MKPSVRSKLNKLLGLKSKDDSELPPNYVCIDKAHIMIAHVVQPGGGTAEPSGDQAAARIKTMDALRRCDYATVVAIPADFLKDAVNAFTGKIIRLRIATDYPLMLFGECEDCELEVAIAPYIDNGGNAHEDQ